MKVRFLDEPAIGWLSFALWLVLLLLAELVAAFAREWRCDEAVLALSHDPLTYVFVFLHQLVFALSFASAIAEETGNRRHRAVLISFWGGSFAVMLVNALLPLFRSEELAVTMSAVLVLLFFSGGFYLITRRCRFSGSIVMALGLFVWLVPAFVLIISYPSII